MIWIEWETDVTALASQRVIQDLRGKCTPPWKEDQGASQYPEDNNNRYWPKEAISLQDSFDLPTVLTGSYMGYTRVWMYTQGSYPPSYSEAHSMYDHWGRVQWGRRKPAKPQVFSPQFNSFVFSLLLLVVLSSTVIPWFISPSIFTILGMANSWSKESWPCTIPLISP